MKEEFLKFERAYLSKFATKSEDTVGRKIPIEPCPLRTEFQRDRDRILHCKSFRRLKHKTQVFLAPTGDHYRTRLTHTIEVSQIARTIARCLKLNEDLTEAIALGHDLGHTPFGHGGEKTLNKITGHFHHNEQSLRVIELLENDGVGLNLTYEVRDGILNHTSSGKPCTLEGCVVSLSDRIAYLNHDIDDAIRAGYLSSADLPEIVTNILGKTKGERINTLVADIVENSYEKGEIIQSDVCKEAMNTLRVFMFKNVYLNKDEKEMDKADRMIILLFQYFCEHTDEIPSVYKMHTDDTKQMVTDYIASMSDVYAMKLFTDVYLPKNFEGQWS